jgi:hypothetical protein
MYKGGVVYAAGGGHIRGTILANDINRLSGKEWAKKYGGTPVEYGQKLIDDRENAREGRSWSKDTAWKNFENNQKLEKEIRRLQLIVPRTPEIAERVNELEKQRKIYEYKASHYRNKDQKTELETFGPVVQSRLERALQNRQRKEGAKAARAERGKSVNISAQVFSRAQQRRAARKGRLSRRGFAMGGQVDAWMEAGGTPRGTDTVPAMLTPGEYIVRREAAQKNMGLLEKINKGQITFAANGGNVGSRPQSTGGGGIDMSRLMESTNRFTQGIAKFEQAVAKMAAIIIPEKIEMMGNHKVEVIINGASVFNEMKPEIQTMIVSEIKKSMSRTFNTITGETYESGENG